MEIPAGIKHNDGFLERWTISFWVILPITLFETNKEHVLIQNIHGEGAYVQIDESSSKLQVVCEETGRICSANIDLK